MILEDDPKQSSPRKTPGSSMEFSRSPRQHRPHKKGASDVCCEYFTEFSANTSLHGIKYIGDNKRSIYEKLWWGIMVGLSVAACGHLIFKVWTKWQQSPVIVTFAESSTPVWQVPFPAITVCSQTKARQSVYNFTKYYHKYPKDVTDEEKRNFEDISLVCQHDIATQENKTTDQEAIDFIYRVAPQFEEVMRQCKWKTKSVECSKLFTPILTEEGLCFTFNMLDSQELFYKERMHDEYKYLNHGQLSQGWTLDGGYPEHVPLETYPTRGTGLGIKAGMTLLLRAYTNDLDYLCSRAVQGFKIHIHSPAEFPRVSQQFITVSLGQEMIVAIKPNMMTTSEGLRGYLPERRQCYFPSEKHLKYFRVYSQENCELECLSNYTMMSCDCVAFAMPRDPSMPICSAGSLKCVHEAADNLLTRDIKMELEENSLEENASSEERKEYNSLERVAAQCECLPACTSINYDAETSQADFNWRKLFNAYSANSSENYFLSRNEDASKVSNETFARVLIFFKESQFIMSRRSELYGQIDFLANCGGLLGLFLGFSILSLVEIIYFITLRAVCTRASRGIQSEDNLQAIMY